MRFLKTPNYNHAHITTPRFGLSRYALSTPPIQSRLPAAETEDPVASSTHEASACPFVRSLQDVPEFKNTFWGAFSIFATDSYKFQTKVVQGRPWVRSPVYGTEHLFSGTFPTTRHVLGHRDAFVMESEPAAAMLGYEGVLFLNGEKHEFVRSILAPLFAPEAIEKYTPKVQAAIEKQLERLAAASQHGRPATAHLYMRHATFEIICSVVLGLELTDTEMQQLYEDFNKLGQGILFKAINMRILDLPFLPGGQAKAAHKRVFDHVAGALDAATESLAKGESVDGKGVFQEIVAAASQKLSRQQLLDNMVFFLNGGFDTTSSMLTELMYNMYRYSGFWQDVVQEQERAVARHGQHITSAVLKDMQYADRFVRETLRLRHPVAQLVRTAVRDVKVGDVMLPERTQVVLPLQMHAIDDPIWEGAEGNMCPTLFNPDRYVESKGLGQSTVFGYGKHSCLGQPLAMMEAKVMLAVLARGFEVKVAEEPTEYRTLPVVTPSNWLPVVLTAKV